MNNLLTTNVRYFHEGSKEIQAYTHAKIVKAMYVPLPENLRKLSEDLEDFITTLKINRFAASFNLSLQKSSSERIRQAINEIKNQPNKGKLNNWSGLYQPGWCMFYLKIIYTYIRQYGIEHTYNYLKNDLLAEKESSGKMQKLVAKILKKDYGFEQWAQRLEKEYELIKSPENKAKSIFRQKSSHPKFNGSIFINYLY